MGCACLRGDGHRRPVRGAGRTAARRRQAGGIAPVPDVAGAHARPELLRRGGDTDAVRFRDREAQPDADTDSETVGIGQPIGDRDRQRLGDPVPIADRDGITVAQRQRETLGLALGPL